MKEQPKLNRNFLIKHGWHREHNKYVKDHPEWVVYSKGRALMAATLNAVRPISWAFCDRCHFEEAYPVIKTFEGFLHIKENQFTTHTKTPLNPYT